MYQSYVGNDQGQSDASRINPHAWLRKEAYRAIERIYDDGDLSFEIRDGLFAVQFCDRVSGHMTFEQVPIDRGPQMLAYYICWRYIRSRVCFQMDDEQLAILKTAAYNGLGEDRTPIRAVFQARGWGDTTDDRVRNQRIVCAAIMAIIFDLIWSDDERLEGMWFVSNGTDALAAE